MELGEIIQIYAPDGVLDLANRERFETLKKVMTIPFAPELHYPVIYIHLHYAMLNEAKQMLDLVEDKEDETYKQLSDLYEALTECERANVSGGSVFPLDVPFRDWWKGPHMKFPNQDKIIDFFPLRVNLVEEKSIYLTVAQVEDGIKYGFFDFPLDERILSTPEQNSLGEIAFYGDAEGDYLINFYPKHREWTYPPELEAVKQKSLPYIKRSDELFWKKVEDSWDETTNNLPGDSTC